MRYLIARGADVHARDLNGFNAAHLAAEAGHKEVALLYGMPLPSAPLVEEMVAKFAFMRQQAEALAGGPKKEDKPKKGKKK